MVAGMETAHKEEIKTNQGMKPTNYIIQTYMYMHYIHEVLLRVTDQSLSRPMLAINYKLLRKLNQYYNGLCADPNSR